MVEIIVGEKGTGKTKHLLDRVNQDITSVQGTLVYIDKSPKYMYQLDSRVRMINMPDYPISGTEELICFLCGVISQNSSIETIFIDSFHVNFVLSVSQKEEKLPEELNATIWLSL